MSSSIFDQVGQVIVAADEDAGLVILWNQSATLNLYGVDNWGKLEAFECKTLSNTRHDGSVSYDDAKACAEQWLEDLRNETEEE